MILTIDIGNTCFNIGVYDNDNLTAFFRMSTDHNRTDDQYASDIYSLLSFNNIDIKKIEGAVISSVVPILTVAVQSALKKLCDCQVFVVGPGIKTGLNIKVDNPSQLGADLVAASVASVAKYPLPQIVFDLGTATTISVINNKGEYVGCVITAGVGISLDALLSNTAMLYAVNLESPGNVIGTNTGDCIKSGSIYGTASMIDGMIDRIEKELGEKATVISTGGRSSNITKHCNHEIIFDEYLLMDGLKRIFDKNIQ